MIVSDRNQFLSSIVGSVWYNCRPTYLCVSYCNKVRFRHSAIKIGCGLLQSLRENLFQKTWKTLCLLDQKLILMQTKLEKLRLQLNFFSINLHDNLHELVAFNSWSQLTPVVAIDSWWTQLTTFHIITQTVNYVYLSATQLWKVAVRVINLSSYHYQWHLGRFETCMAAPDSCLWHASNSSRQLWKGQHDSVSDYRNRLVGSVDSICW